MKYARSYADCLPPDEPSDEEIAFDLEARDDAIAEIADWRDNKSIKQWLSADPSALAAIRGVMCASDPDERAAQATGMREQFATYFDNTGSIDYLVKRKRYFS